MGKKKKKQKQGTAKAKSGHGGPSAKPLELPAFTLFCLPKAFAGPFDLIQRNAIGSWLKLEPCPEILIMGDDPGVEEFAAETGLEHIRDLERNEFGTPLVNRVFETAEARASNDVLVYVNADIILSSDFIPALAAVHTRFDQFLMIGRRWDMDVDEPVDFDAGDWEKKLRKQLTWKGELHSVNGIDYFAYVKGLYPEIPPFAVGRTAWDNWLVYDPIRRQIPVVDATEAVTIIHQNHDYSHMEGGREAAWHGPEAKRNQALITPEMMAGVTSSATWELGPRGLKQRNAEKESRADRIAKVQRIYADGLALMEEGRLAPAVDKFNDALGLCRDFTVTNVNLAKAMALEKLGRIDEARTALEMELRVSPGDKDVSEMLNKLQAAAPATTPY